MANIMYDLCLVPFYVWDNQKKSPVRKTGLYKHRWYMYVVRIDFIAEFA